MGGRECSGSPEPACVKRWRSAPSAALEQSAGRAAIWPQGLVFTSKKGVCLTPAKESPSEDGAGCCTPTSEQVELKAVEQLRVYTDITHVKTTHFAWSSIEFYLLLVTLGCNNSSHYAAPFISRSQSRLQVILQRGRLRHRVRQWLNWDWTPRLLTPSPALH